LEQNAAIARNGLFPFPNHDLEEHMIAPSVTLSSLMTMITSSGLLFGQVRAGEAGMVGVGWLCCMLPFVIINIAGIAFWVWMIVDCATKEPSEGNDKIVWLLIVILTSWIGALIYYFVRRPQRIKQYGE
jgi:hypothetical protein